MRLGVGWPVPRRRAGCLRCLGRVVRGLGDGLGAARIACRHSLPGEGAGRAALRERARQLAAVTDARLLPVYGQGEDEHVLWLATRQIAGRPLSELGRLDERRAARVGAQIAGQLAALQEAGLPPATIAADDILVEDVGGRERAWLLPDPLRAVGDDAASATRSLARLLGDTVGRPLVTDPPSDPQTLSELLASRADRRQGGASCFSARRPESPPSRP